MRLLRNVSSVILACLSWVGFGFLWWWAFAHTSSSTLEVRDLNIIGVVSLIIVVVSYAWVNYNVWLYRHHKWTGPRHKRPELYDYSVDTMNRPVTADFTKLAGARYIIVDIKKKDGREVKIYNSGSEELTEEEVGMCEIL